MKKILLVFLFIVPSFLFSFCQTTQFETYKVKDFGYISIPNNLELQSGIYKLHMETYLRQINPYDYEIPTNRAAFQQKGVNKGEKTNTYARVIVVTYVDLPGTYEKLNNVTPPTQPEIKELNSFFKSSIEESFMNTRLKLLNWYGTDWVKINSSYAIRYSYLRKLQGRPPVYVEVYGFLNNDRTHYITLSYRQEDKNLWQPLYKKILESIKINAIE